MTSLESRARDFAAAAHVGQVRKYTGEPYINHPAAVVEIVRSVPHDEEMLAAAWLHDVVEDCAVPIATIDQQFGIGVGRLVRSLTKASCPEDGNRAARLEVDRHHISTAHSRAKTIKLADIIDNCSSILVRDPKFAPVYLREKAMLLEVLRDGDPTLWGRAAEIAQAAGIAVQDSDEMSRV